ncbi:MAG: phosphoribosylaminoimidazolesuccinocarboxamide synthase [Candidatus Doudnabacteria bacterium]|nr:phosphoribosylaminoimidazolesuccinocarboxamide synthase [Candidatus Doudnabacteria bacterium]
MDKQTIEQNLNRVLEKTDFKNLGERRQGKVRDIYTQADKIILVSTDRYSAFDRNLALIPFKGQVLTEISRFWFDQTANIIQNHLIGSPDPNVVVVKKCSVIPIEMVVRGYITGVTGTSLWTLYQNGQRDFGDFTLAEGMKKNQKLNKAVLTPTTKSEDHDKPLTTADILKEKIVPAELWRQLSETAIKLFTRGQEIALKRGLILVDTKYEFGLTDNNQLILIDEIHTPDSSRYWQADSYQQRIDAGLEPQNFDKEFLRLWFKEHCDPYKDEVLPKAPPDMIAELSSRYIQIYEQITDKKFETDLQTPIVERIEKNLQNYLLNPNT